MALYRGSTKLAGIGKGFNPENTGTEGQVLTKTCSGYAYCDTQGGDTKVVDVMLVGGGGGGGKGCYSCYGQGGGGGAGGVKFFYGVPLTKKSLSVVVGSGGSGGTSGRGGNGGCSKFGVLYALGGGGGGGGGPVASCAGGDGANGGGGGFFYCNMTKGGKGMDQGNLGAFTQGCEGRQGGGGGGAGGSIETMVGMIQDRKRFTRGGPGIKTCFGGTERNVGGGGGGAGTSYASTNFENYLGIGYGGARSNSDVGNGCAGCPNTGGGGGGGWWNNNCNGGAGGSGLVIVRYPSDGSYGIACATGGTITTATINGIAYTIHTFTSSGTFEITG